MVLRCVLYARVSTDAQERDGTSLDTQERACLEYAETNGWVVVESVRDAASGFTLDRPGIERLRRLLHQGGIDVIVSYAVDRLSRNQNHIGVLFDLAEQSSARMEFVTERFEDTAVGRFILAARAFIGEVEREKIAERTMRGKAERARSGRLPQGTGKGIYGYRYSQESGRRDIDLFQATVVRRIFERYLETRSFSAVSNELNTASIPSFCGRRWYPLTVRTVLINETYTGRTIYRKTKRVALPRGANGKRRTKIVERPSEEWINIEGASPRIVDENLWTRVQEIINDPERIRRRPNGRFYPLSGHTRCGICGAAVVGQTLTVKGRPFRYYRCRHVYDKNSGHECTARYIRADRLETAVWSEVKKILTNPAVVLQELARQEDDAAETGQSVELEDAISSLTEREKRLVRLYTLGEIDQALVREEAKSLRGQRELLEQRLSSLAKRTSCLSKEVNAAQLEKVCHAVAAWLDNADERGRTLALEALQVSVRATKDSAQLMGVLPAREPEFISDEHSSQCLCSGEVGSI